MAGGGEEMLQLQHRHQQMRAIVLICARAAIATCQAAIDIATPLIIDRTPYHTSALSGQAWVEELLNGHPSRIYNELGVHRRTFSTLVRTLEGLGIQSSRYVTAEEQVAIFLYTVVTGLSSIHVGERFQRSPSTISK